MSLYTTRDRQLLYKVYKDNGIEKAVKILNMPKSSIFGHIYKLIKEQNVFDVEHVERYRTDKQKTIFRYYLKNGSYRTMQRFKLTYYALHLLLYQYIKMHNEFWYFKKQKNHHTTIKMAYCNSDENRENISIYVNHHHQMLNEVHEKIIIKVLDGLVEKEMPISKNLIRKVVVKVLLRFCSLPPEKIIVDDLSVEFLYQLYQQSDEEIVKVDIF